MLIERAREILDIGRRKGEGWFYHYTLGTNYRITALQSAVLIAQLERLPEQNAATEQCRHDPVSAEGGPHIQRVPAAARVHTNYLLLGWVDSDRTAFPSGSRPRDFRARRSIRTPSTRTRSTATAQLPRDAMPERRGAHHGCVLDSSSRAIGR